MYYRLFCKPYPQYNHLFKSSKCLARTTELANSKWLEQKVVEWKMFFLLDFFLKSPLQIFTSSHSIYKHRTNALWNVTKVVKPPRMILTE